MPGEGLGTWDEDIGFEQKQFRAADLREGDGQFGLGS